MPSEIYGTNGTGLAGDAAALDMGLDVELSLELHCAEGLLHDHAAGFAAEEIVQRASIDRHLAGTLMQIHPRTGSFAAAGPVKGIGGFCHS